MRPIKLILSGWGPYRNKVEIDFSVYDGQGLFLITGPTGAGKTTLFDAITYALYGSLSGEIRDKEKNSVRSDFATEEVHTFVELLMEHRGQNYRIHRSPRYLRPKKRSRGSSAFVEEKETALLYLPDETVVDGVKEVNAKLLDILSLDYNQFKQISMIAQGEFARLLTAAPKDKTKIFREIFATGMYDRFTAALSSRAKQLYAGVMEQRHKLEEDIRLLTVGIETSVWDEAWQKRLLFLTDGEHLNYQQLQVCLEEMKAEASSQLQRVKKRYTQNEKLAEKLSRQLTVQTQENEKFLKLQAVTAQRMQMKEERKVWDEKERLLKNALNAAAVELSEEKARAGSEAFNKNQLLQKKLITEMKEWKQELRANKEIMEQGEFLTELLLVAEQLQMDKREYQKLLKEKEEKERQLAEGQKAYLAKEKESLERQSAYEEADRERKLSAIGIAAGMLEAGRPCPVCGSTLHPDPAKVREDILSEEELQILKEKWEACLAELQAVHGQVVERNTQLKLICDSLAERNIVIDKSENMLKKQRKEIIRQFLSMEPVKARKQLQEELNRLKKLIVMISEREKQIVLLKDEEAACAEYAEETAVLFREALTQYGFRSKVLYEQSKMSGTERQKLDRELKAFRSREAANAELYDHLKNTVKSTEIVDLEPLKEKLEQVKRERAEALELQRSWDRYHAEVIKTLQMMQSRKLQMEENEREYGFVKDLENMASGNNPKKLVFEQYVLAGYFEEILRAANLRLQRMSAGRYEMSRVEQVLDGRVKDNLEIQVMDFYTGKLRSVRTLSGGESFKASLSLALGMSDVIQAMSGGITVDTLFIDEGFGALDSESLDQACETLMSLVEKNKLIGIISHVPELRDRIDKQLIVDRTQSGSTVRVVG